MLTLGYVMVALLLILGVVDVSAVFLARRALASTADGAALAAAQQIDEGAVYTATGPVNALPLGDVDGEVNQYAAQVDPGGGTTLVGTLTNATTVHVVGTRVVTLPFVRVLGIGRVTITASADAEAAVRPAGVAP